MEYNTVDSTGHNKVDSTDMQIKKKQDTSVEYLCSDEHETET